MDISTGVYLTHLLRAYGVDMVFGIPGVHTIELYRGLAGSGIRHVTPRHEQGAGFMADGYARASGRPGVCFIISGPGMTNIVTAMGQAYADSVPMLVISTVNAHGRMGSGEGWLHELPNQQALVAGVAAFSRTVHRPEELATTLAQAFAVFDGARPRPVHVELPIDVMLAPAGHLALPGRAARVTRPAPDPEAVARAAAALAGARAPLILAGGGAVGAAQAVRQLAEALDAPVVMTTNARGILPPDHPLGVSLSPSMAATRALIAGADVVLAIGTEMGPTDYDFFEDGGFELSGMLIRADIDAAQIQRGTAPAMAIVGDARLTAEALAAGIGTSGMKDGAARAAAAQAGRTALPRAIQGDLHLLDLVRGTLPEALIVGDSTQLVYAGNTAFAAATPGSYFNSATGFGTLGYGLPAAVGARLSGDRPVVALSGDGGLQFTLGELASAAEARVPVVLMLHDNKGYGEIRSSMIAQNVPPLGVDILTPDLGAIAAACGWRVERLHKIADLPEMLRRGIAADGPTMIVFGDALRDEAQAAAGF
ncbi:MAG: 5-guanidino-2-oxopentanoate decarboxylase [Rhodobacteraceae bacterium]|jgi:acetolactate synthase-1/2/3 large subunit|nr:5-guanidino-2-oxopentanoate decarboxylase [uncultured Defluviimonas sp.]MCB2125061.1 5-guanidino-2-oxopentanoate decarboxylase [Paracoccaceae bacterium]MCC0068439.1 5-guanidino-2-oxopentanoate decarboxylase [Paracoccaceae bacterium]